MSPVFGEPQASQIASRGPVFSFLKFLTRGRRRVPQGSTGLEDVVVSVELWSSNGERFPGGNRGESGAKGAKYSGDSQGLEVSISISRLLLDIIVVLTASHFLLYKSAR